MAYNVRTLNQELQLDLLLDKLEKFNIGIAGISDTHWFSVVDVAFQQNGYTIIHSGREGGIHRQVVALDLSSESANGLLSYEAVSPRMVSVVKQELVCVKHHPSICARLISP